MMTLHLQENSDFTDRVEHFEARSSSTVMPPTAKKTRGFHIFAEKLRMPRFEGIMARPRLDEILHRSCSQCGAALISGRAGTGKTIAAANFASRYSNVAWYTVESADSDWEVFSHYLNAALMKTNVFGQCDVSIMETPEAPEDEKVSRFVTDLFSQTLLPAESPLLIVLDDIQHLFDAHWFNEFFAQLIYSLVPDIHLVMLCRSKPPLPLWRMRSKQRLNVIDEKLLAFTQEEAESFYKGHGLSGDAVREIHRASFGRAAKLTRFAGAETSKPT